ncbi:MAG: response regulator [Actinobacteria bacterium HGW-Actinobacteria-7]|nr:MAG: response regulator [Actinobacteria bacterium HGW-Actinobacteria-7]
MGKRILVVEDDPQNLYLVTYLLEHAGFEVIPATDGEQAVELAVQPFDLVLLDMLLPRMSGHEAAPLIRAALPEPCRIIALTAYSMKGDREQILAVCDGYIAKPIDPESFIGSVEEQIS